MQGVDPSHASGPLMTTCSPGLLRFRVRAQLLTPPYRFSPRGHFAGLDFFRYPACQLGLDDWIHVSVGQRGRRPM
jgi:hypothetical protein